MGQQRVLFVTPPLHELHTPYPATAYLSAFLRDRGFEADQVDLSLDLALRVFSKKSLDRLRARLVERYRDAMPPPSVESFLSQFDAFHSSVEPAIAMLQSNDPGLAIRAATANFFPKGVCGESFDEQEYFAGAGALRQGLGSKLFAEIEAKGVLTKDSPVFKDALGWTFGRLGTQDRARWLSTRFLFEIAEVIREGIDPKFQLMRWGEDLGFLSRTFEPIEETLSGPPTLIDEIFDELAEEVIAAHDCDLIAVSIPFPGNVYGAFRFAKVARKLGVRAKLALGGGYVNTELRSLSDAKVFDYYDFVCYDSGEAPLLALLEHLRGECGVDDLFRTRVRAGGEVVMKTTPARSDVPFAQIATPSYRGLELDRYLGLLPAIDPSQRITWNARWNKLVLAHGCYWKKCTFCDVSLDYIGRYDPVEADILVEHMERMIAETGQRGFHFVDEAAPPAVLRALSQRIIDRNLKVSWWGNMRFEKTFTRDLTDLMARAGCIAVSGGLEVASNRMLEVIDKGITVEQTARVTHAFASSGIFVHAYLIFGYPTETEQETIDALECVRQLFEAGCLHSGVFNRFIMTPHSPIGLDPARFGVVPRPRPPATFTDYMMEFDDPSGVPHERYEQGLQTALRNYMHGLGLERKVVTWFDGFEPPTPSIPPDLVKQAIRERDTPLAPQVPTLRRLRLMGR